MPAISAAQLSALSPEHQLRRKEILERSQYIDREDYFQMLDVERTATSEELREAFFKLAKVWHPDRLPEPLSDARESCARVFGRMSEAHQTLTDAKKRARYMTLLTEGGATPEAQATIALVVEAATNFQKAEICLKRNDLAQAEALCKQAHDADPQQPDYLALLAWLRSMKPEGQTASGAQGAIKLLDRAVGLSARCERAYFYRGQIHKRLGNTQLAIRDFRKAADLNPRNIDAVREVRLHEMRSQKGGSVPPPASIAPPRKGKPEAKPSGLFGKLFKK
jgi:curved DNA-binding protein CbpA